MEPQERGMSDFITAVQPRRVNHGSFNSSLDTREVSSFVAIAVAVAFIIDFWGRASSASWRPWPPNKPKVDGEGDGDGYGDKTGDFSTEGSNVAWCAANFCLHLLEVLVFQSSSYVQYSWAINRNIYKAGGVCLITWYRCTGGGVWVQAQGLTRSQECSSATALCLVGAGQSGGQHSRHINTDTTRHNL